MMQIRKFYKNLDRKELYLGLILPSFMINILGLTFPLVLLKIYDKVIPYNDESTLVFLTAIVIIFLLLEMILRILRLYIAAKTDAKLSYTTMKRCYKRLINATNTSYHGKSVGVHISNLNNIDILKEVFGGQGLIIVLECSFSIIFLSLIFHIGGTLVLVPILIYLGIISIIKIYNKNFLTKNILAAKNSSDRTNFILEVLNGIHNIKSSALEAQILRRYERQQINHISDNYLNTEMTNYGETIISIGTQITVILTVALGTLMVIQGYMTIGGLAACILLSTRSLMPVSKAIFMWERMQTIKIALLSEQEIMSLDQEEYIISDVIQFEPEIVLKDFSLAYSKIDIVFESANCVFSPYKIHVITGKGSIGKSSLLESIMGLWEHQGSIYYGGYQKQQIAAEEFSRKINLLTSEPVLFKGSILENLTLFHDNIPISKVTEICTELGINEEILSMNSGYNTPVGKTASEGLSRGLQQMILLARHFIANPKVLLLDEANIALDYRSLQLVTNYLKKIKHKTTIIIVTNNTNILSVADTIYTIKNKKILELR